MSTKNHSDKSGFLVVCEVGSEPQIVPFCEKDAQEQLRTTVSEMLELVLYPKYLMKGMPKNICVLGNENGLEQGLPANRWGLVGNFVVCRSFVDFKGLKREHAEIVVKHITEEYGYFRQDSGVLTPGNQGLGLYGPHLTDPERLRMEGRWKPGVQFVGQFDPKEVPFLNWLMWRYSRNIVAAGFYSPFLGCFGVQIQFGESEEDRRAERECIRLYESSGTDSGELKPSLCKRPPAA